jgi:anti-sigma factor RsiW
VRVFDFIRRFLSTHQECRKSHARVDAAAAEGKKLTPESVRRRLEERRKPLASPR